MCLSVDDDSVVTRGSREPNSISCRSNDTEVINIVFMGTPWNTSTVTNKCTYISCTYAHTDAHICSFMYRA